MPIPVHFKFLGAEHLNMTAPSDLVLNIAREIEAEQKKSRESEIQSQESQMHSEEPKMHHAEPQMHFAKSKMHHTACPTQHADSTKMHPIYIMHHAESKTDPDLAESKTDPDESKIYNSSGPGSMAESSATIKEHVATSWLSTMD